MGSSRKHQKMLRFSTTTAQTTSYNVSFNENIRNVCVKRRTAHEACKVFNYPSRQIILIVLSLASKIGYTRQFSFFSNLDVYTFNLSLTNTRQGKKMRRRVSLVTSLITSSVLIYFVQYTVITNVPLCIYYFLCLYILYIIH